MMNRLNPTESELEILQILWEHGPQAVRFVNDTLNQHREVGYTTTLKIMQIMVDKGLAIRNTDSRTHIYAANIKEENTKGNLLRSFIDNTFKGSASSLVMQLLGDTDTSKKDLEEIKTLIENLETKSNAK